MNTSGASPSWKLATYRSLGLGIILIAGFAYFSIKISSISTPLLTSLVIGSLLGLFWGFALGKSAQKQIHSKGVPNWQSLGFFMRLPFAHLFVLPFKQLVLVAIVFAVIWPLLIVGILLASPAFLVSGLFFVGIIAGAIISSALLLIF